MAGVVTGKREPDLQTLLDRLKDPEATRRLSAVVVLGNLGPAVKQAVPALLHATRDRATEVRRLTIPALIQIAPDESIVPGLLAMLRDPEPRVSRRALLGLGEIGPAARGAIPPLVVLLRDTDDLVRRLAASALGDIGVPTLPAIAALVEMLGEDDMKNGAVAMASLRKFIGRAVPRLIDALRHDNPRIRRGAARILGHTERGREALLELHLLLHDGVASVREAAKQTLDRLLH